jgi:hypothetical protein
MTSEEKVKKLWPGARIEREDGRRWRVTIKPGRYTYGIQKRWAWREALDSITQDDELSKGAT